MPKNQLVRGIDQRRTSTGAVIVSGGSGSGGGVTDHGLLTGLGDDDHTHYLTSGRGDLRYVPLTREVNPGNGLTGGGALSGNVTLSLASTTGGAGITYTAGVLSIGTGDGLTVGTDNVSLTTPGTLTVSTTNDATGSHTHAVTASSDVSSGVAALLKSTAAGLLTLAQLTAATKVRTPKIDTGSGYLELSPYASRVGVNTAAPDYALDVVGTIRGQTAVRSPSIVGTTSVTTPLLDATSNLTLQPGGDIILAPGGFDVLPESTITTDLGDYNRLYRTLFAAEMYVQTLVAQDVVSTIGGRIEVTPTTSLIAALDNTATTMDVKANNLRNGEYAYMMAVHNGTPHFEAIKVVSAASTITGGYRYTITRNLDGTGANDWQAGDAVASLGKDVGEGTISLTSTSTVLNHAGPTVAIYARNNTAAWNNLTPTVAVGQLSSFAGYASSMMGIAIGNDLTLDPALGYFKGLTADATNGLRLWNTPIQLFSSGVQTVNIDADGTNVWIGSTGDKRLYWDGTDLRIGGSGTGAWYISANKISSSYVRLISSATVANARIEVGDATASTNVQSAVAGVRGGDGTTLSGIAFWAGRPHAYRTSSPFYVTMGGSLYAGDATLTGSLTAGNVAITPTDAMTVGVGATHSDAASIRFMRGGVKEGQISAYTGFMTLFADGVLFLSADSISVPTGCDLVVTDDVQASSVWATRLRGGATTSYLTSFSGTDIISFTSTAFTSTIDLTAPAFRVASGTGYLKVGSTNVASFTSTVFNVLQDLGEASWTALAYDSAFPATRTGTVYVKRFGDQVFYRGSCKSSTATGNVTALTIPNGYTRPSSTIIIYLPRSNGSLIKATIVGNSSGGGTLSFTSYTTDQDIYFDNVALMAS